MQLQPDARGFPDRREHHLHRRRLARENDERRRELFYNGNDPTGTHQIHVDFHQAVYDAGGRLWVSSDGGVYRTADGVTYTNLNTELDEVIGQTGNDTLNGGAGDDELLGMFGFDTINGGAGDGTATGGGSADTINGDDGNDNPDEIHGGAGDDTINGGPQNDQLFGDAGDNDDLNGQAGPTHSTAATASTTPATAASTSTPTPPPPPASR